MSIGTPSFNPTKQILPNNKAIYLVFAIVVVLLLMLDVHSRQTDSAHRTPTLIVVSLHQELSKAT